MKKKHTLIVGGTKVVGNALIRILRDESHVLSVIGRDPPTDTNQNSQNINYWSLDLLDLDSIPKVLDSIIEKNGKLNNLVFFQRYKGRGNNWSGEITVSITATKNIIEYLTDKFDDFNGNSIVIVSSIASNLIVEEQSLSYHVAKAALNQMIRYYAVALGPKGIKVNGVSPSTILKEESTKYHSENSLYKKIIPLGRMATSEDVGNVISFLCSQKASFLTGQNLVLDGGLFLQGHETIARKVNKGLK